ncbi:DUF429 domain-containing protein [Nocardioides sp. TRM66260-LWL]|uniref:DUF429 domain-containing protein n=1 Tax=Nocardioides sp. TRM66260-LWL TaxID=2874478 RepID=UPI001CC5780D|nr:DUF429 domain-containing protein [Nocardioides sp. TRM66260-LWL]MBZ5735615.1 DUF429 domain-containing protein [Nocardioides sp. TRM66260-LWL]
MPEPVVPHAVGLDLAWGLRSPSGVAVLDAGGRLLDVCAARSDEEVVAALTPWLPHAVVGIDAPLIVANATGSRPAEQALGRDFRRFEAGCHPSNTGKPEFAEGTRAARVAALLGLPLDPGPDVDPRTPRAIEVYPHAATVALFDLPRILRYKAKPGRSLDDLRGELLRLMDLLETVVDTRDGAGAEPWARLRQEAATTTTKAGLRRVEDPVDAVVCAHVAWLAIHEPDALARYGEPDTGVIVTPALPAHRRGDPTSPPGA